MVIGKQGLCRRHREAGLQLCGWEVLAWFSTGAVMLVWRGELGSVLSVCGVVYCGDGLRSLQVCARA